MWMLDIVKLDDYAIRGIPYMIPKYYSTVPKRLNIMTRHRMKDRMYRKQFIGCVYGSIFEWLISILDIKNL